jgi:hypothetical protein
MIITMLHIIKPSMPEETGGTAEEKSSPHPIRDENMHHRLMHDDLTSKGKWPDWPK